MERGNEPQSLYSEAFLMRYQFFKRIELCDKKPNPISYACILIEKRMKNMHVKRSENNLLSFDVENFCNGIK